MEIPLFVQVVVLVSYAIMSGVIGWAIGNHKKQGVAGIFWGIILGPIGWIVTATLPADGVKCPQCGGVLSVEGTPKCMHCGSDIAGFWRMRKLKGLTGKK